jgi:hypothetical protein
LHLRKLNSRDTNIVKITTMSECICHYCVFNVLNSRKRINIFPTCVCGKVNIFYTISGIYRKNNSDISQMGLKCRECIELDLSIRVKYLYCVRCREQINKFNRFLYNSIKFNRGGYNKDLISFAYHPKIEDCWKKTPIPASFAETIVRLTEKDHEYKVYNFWCSKMGDKFIILYQICDRHDIISDILQYAYKILLRTARIRKA